MELIIKNIKNEEVGKVKANDQIFGLEPRTDILHRVVRWQLAKRQAGTHSTKTIAHVSGTTKKMYRQKGTGNARHGSARGMLFRGGAVVFGPTPRSHAHDLQKKVRSLGLKMALSAKQAEGKLVVVDDIAMKKPQTKEAQKMLSTLGLTSALFIDGDAVDQNFGKAIANLYRVDALPTMGANVYDILQHDHLVLTKSAIEKLEARLS